MATIAFAWQALTYWDAKRPKLIVTAEHAFDALSESADRALSARVLGEQFNHEDLSWFIRTRIVNVGRSKVYLNDIDVVQGVGGSRRRWNASEGAQLPRWLEPGESLDMNLSHEDLAGVSVGDPLTISFKTPVGHSSSAQVNLDGSEGSVMLTPGRYEELANAMRRAGNSVPEPDSISFIRVDRNDESAPS
ncbi:hypothetical protein [Streptomyces pseudoechinosporeus]